MTTPGRTSRQSPIANRRRSPRVALFLGFIAFSVAMPAWAQTANAPNDSQRKVEGTEPSQSSITNETARPIDVQVRGTRSETKRLRASAEAVGVVDARVARQQTREMGDILAGVEGVAVRRSGGLGSSTRFSLNGLYDNQIRILFDGVPLDVAGSTFGISAIPVNLIERVEIYRGVVPLRFGIDALGGAVNLVPVERRGNNLSVSWQRGSFGTYRATLGANYRHMPSGIVVGTNAWYDRSRNDYEIEVEVGDKLGRVSTKQVKRFHDAYLAYGGVVSVGVLDKPWAKRLTLLAFGSAFEKEVQHDVTMTRPIGEARQAARAMGVTLRYDQPLHPALDLSVVTGFSKQSISFLDVSDWTYDWYGRRTGRRNRPGELFREPRNSSMDQDGLFVRANLQWQRGTNHRLRFGFSSRYGRRTGQEKGITGPNGIDPLAGQRGILAITSGIEYEWSGGQLGLEEIVIPEDHRLQNIAFVKLYAYDAKARDVLVEASLESIASSNVQIGLGDSLRYRLAKPLSLKASYEWATRIPTIDELFGDGLYVVPNVQLTPETSHNVNVGIVLDAQRTRTGNYAAELHGFLRETGGLIAATPDTTAVQYKNIAGARTVGIEGSLKWSSPKRFITLETNGTWQDVRNQSDSGPFAKYDGERIPNRPWLFANAAARLEFRNVLAPLDTVAPFYFGRWVHEFFRNWESIGNREFKAIVPSQAYHTVGITYSTVTRIPTTVTFEVDNVADNRVYDFFGVQRPGRTFSVKVTADL